MDSTPNDRYDDWFISDHSSSDNELDVDADTLDTWENYNSEWNPM